MTILTEKEARIMVEEQGLLDKFIELETKTIEFGKKMERKRIKKIIEEIWKKWEKEHREIHPDYDKEECSYCECYGINSIEKFKKELIKKIRDDKK